MSSRTKRARLALQRFYYLRRHGVKIGPSGAGPPNTMRAQFGKGKYVSVLRRGAYLDIRDERTGEMIRLVPYQPNHGVMVEYWAAPGRMEWRTHCDLNAFRSMGFARNEKPRDGTMG